VTKKHGIGLKDYPTIYTLTFGEARPTNPEEEIYVNGSIQEKRKHLLQHLARFLYPRDQLVQA
jgi:hypothetical protein